MKWPALVVAAYEGDSEKVYSILAENADPDTTDILGRTALIQAAAQGHYDVLGVLLTSKADVNFSPSLDGRSALHWAAKYNHEECCKLLQSHGANVLSTDIYGQSAQELAMIASSNFILVPDCDPIPTSELANELANHKMISPCSENKCFFPDTLQS